MTMKVRSLALILAFVLVMGPAAVALANSNPFSDVPADHWAYDAVIQLAAVGLVEGYPDGTYGGTRMMTRYEAALVFARTLARLEALVEEEVYATNADLRAQVVAEVLADIEAAKAELAALIKDELAKIEVPVVEHTIERVVVEQPIEKIVEVQPVERPFQLTPEAQNIISKLVADLFKQELEAAELGAQEVIVETRILERIVEAEDALTEEDVNRIVEAILAAEFERVSREHAQSQAEIDKAHAELAAAHAELAAAQADLDARVEAILKRINALESGQASLVAGQDALAAEVAELAAAADEEQARVAGLISGLQADVNGLEKALVGEIDRVMNAIYALNDEFKTELALLGVRVDTLEKLFISLEDRISGVEGRVALVEQEQVSLRKDLERVQLSGKLTFDASSEHTKIEDTVPDYFGTEYKHAALGLTQKGELKLTVKASDRVTVGAFTKYAVDIFNTQNIDFSEYRVEVTSDTPITKFVAGNKLGDHVSKAINSYVLADKPAQGATAEFKFFEGLTGAAVVGGAKDDLVAAAALSYEFIPQLGLRGAISGSRDNEESRLSAGSAGIFGELFGLNYEGNFAIDLTDKDAEKNMLFGAKLSGEFGPAKLSGEYAWAGDEFGVDENSLSGRPFVLDDASSMFELGAEVEFLGIDVSGNYYREMGEENAALVQAYKFGAEAKFDVFVPLTLSGKYAWNLTGADPETDSESASEVKAKIGEIDIFGTGVKFDTSFAMVNGTLEDDEYKDKGAFDSDLKAWVIDANLNYGTTVGGAGLDLGYGVKFVMPRVEEGEDPSANELTHKLTAGYSFTDSLKLNLGATVFHTLPRAEDEESVTAQKYTAGLSFTF